jgi:anti-sigma regulatory factor (Ser/Thr protein kinase)
MPYEADRDHMIELRVPASYGFASTVRLIAASVAADAHLSVDDVYDVRLAVNEIFTSAVDSHAVGDHARGDGSITVRYHPSDSGIVVEVVAPVGAPIELDDLAASVIRSAVDDVIVDSAVVQLSKRRSTSLAR